MKIIQIAVTSIGSADDGMDPDFYVLCDDGSIWNFWMRKWKRLPALPPEEEPAAPKPRETAA